MERFLLGLFAAASLAAIEAHDRAEHGHCDSQTIARAVYGRQFLAELDMLAMQKTTNVPIVEVETLWERYPGRIGDCCANCNCHWVTHDKVTQRCPLALYRSWCSPREFKAHLRRLHFQSRRSA